LELPELVPAGDAQRDLVEAQLLVGPQVAHALVGRAGRDPALDELRVVVQRVVDVEEALGLVERGRAVLVDVDVVVQVGLDAGRVAAGRAGPTADVLDAPAQVLHIAQRGLPAVGVIDDPLVGALDQLLAAAGVVGDPDRRARLRSRPWFGGEAPATQVLTLDRDVVFGPQLLDERDPLDQALDAVGRLQAIQLALDAAAFLGHDARAGHQHAATLGQQVQTGPLVGQQDRVAQR